MGRGHTKGLSVRVPDARRGIGRCPCSDCGGPAKLVELRVAEQPQYVGLDYQRTVRCGKCGETHIFQDHRTREIWFGYYSVKRAFGYYPRGGLIVVSADKF